LSTRCQRRRSPSSRTTRSATRGISEAWDDDGEEYGEDRLAELVKKNESLSVVELEKLIQSDVETYTKGRPATDNVTVIIVKRL